MKILFISRENTNNNELYIGLRRMFDIKTCEFSGNIINRNILINKPDLIFVYYDKNFGNFMYGKILENAKNIPVITLCDDGDSIDVTYARDNIKYIYRPISTSGVADEIRMMFDDENTDNVADIVEEAAGVIDNAVSKQESGDINPVSNKVKDPTVNFDITKQNVLAIDDNPQILRNIMSILKPKYNVSVATNVLNAIQMLDSCDGDYDVMLLDYEMPGVDGPTGLTLFRQDPRMAGIPVVFLTGVSDKDRIMKVVDLKPDAYLLKPIDADVLLKTVEDVINKKVGM